MSLFDLVTTTSSLSDFKVRQTANYSGKAADILKNAQTCWQVSKSKTMCELDFCMPLWFYGKELVPRLFLTACSCSLSGYPRLRFPRVLNTAGPLQGPVHFCGAIPGLPQRTRSDHFQPLFFCGNLSRLFPWTLLFLIQQVAFLYYLPGFPQLCYPVFPPCYLRRNIQPS